MNLLSALSSILSSLPNLNLCNNNNCQGARISCCSGSADPLLVDGLLSQNNIVSEYIQTRKFAYFTAQQNNMLVYVHSEFKADLSWICAFSNDFFHKKFHKNTTLSKLKCNDTYLVVEYVPARGLFRRRSHGIIVALSEDEYKSIELSRYTR